MRRILYILFLISIIWACKSNDKETIDAKKYNDEMIVLQKKAEVGIVNLISAIDSQNADRMNESLASAKELISYCISEVEKSDSENNFNPYKNQIMMLLDSYSSIVEEEFRTIIDIYSLPDEEYTEAHKDSVTSLFNESLRKYSLAIAQFADFQENFAKENNLVLQ